MINRRAIPLAGLLIGGVAIASCSSDKVTGGLGGKALAASLDSAFRADSAAGIGRSLKAIGEEEAAFLADEGLEPASVKVNTDGGTILMHMFAATGVDTTAQGKVADSLSLVYGWTPDYQTWLAFFEEQVTKNGPAVGPATIGTGHSRALALLMASLNTRNHRRAHAAANIDSIEGDWEELIWDHGTTFGADSASGVVSWAPASGQCIWQGVALEAPFEADSALPCARAAYSVRLNLHNVESTPSFVHVSIPEQLTPALRLIGFQF